LTLGKTKNREKDGGVSAKGVAGGEGEGARKIQWVMANLGVAFVGEENERRVASRGEQDRWREELNGGDVPACWGSKRLGEVVQELPRGDVVLLE
jgi:hypothetical protein